MGQVKGADLSSVNLALARIGYRVDIFGALPRFDSMKIFIIGLLAGVALLAVSCSDATPSNALPYTLKTCLVSDEKLGSMGDPYVFVHEGQEIKLCCKSCLKEFSGDPMRFLVKLVPPPPLPTEIPK
jgi:hypothetical protein